MEAIRTDKDTARLGRYRLLAELGHGGMAKVSLAVAQGPGGFNKLVVVKQIHEQYAKDPEFVTMFLDEARLAARLQHPHVVQTNEVGEVDGRYFMTMEYLQGQTLSRIRARLGPKGLPLSMHIQVLIDVLAGLHYAHELADYDRTPLNVVHRDATPENVFVTFDGVVKVVDFGIAKARDQVTETLAGTIKGKITYMAPEQARGDDLDRRADIFAVGVMLWEAVTGQRMWRGVSHTAILERLVSHTLPSPLRVNPDIPGPLAAIISKALAPNRDDRYATAAELQADLDLFLGEIGGRATPRELGQLVARHFEAERAEIRTLVQEGLRGAPEPPEGYPPGSSPSAFAKGVTVTRTRAIVQRGALALGIVCTALALGGATTFFTRSTPSRAVVPLAQAPSASAPAPVLVTLRVSAAPREARIFLDDRPLGQSPFTGELPADDANHRLRIEAPGYVTRVEPLTLGRSRELDVTLEQDHEPVAPHVGADGGPAKPERLFLGPRARRQIDNTNPYEPPR